MRSTEQRWKRCSGSYHCGYRSVRGSDRSLLLNARCLCFENRVSQTTATSYIKRRVWGFGVRPIASIVGCMSPQPNLLSNIRHLELDANGRAFGVPVYINATSTPSSENRIRRHPAGLNGIRRSRLAVATQRMWINVRVLGALCYLMKLLKWFVTSTCPAAMFPMSQNALIARTLSIARRSREVAMPSASRPAGLRSASYRA